jgi:zinc transport system substrate-binding protein
MKSAIIFIYSAFGLCGFSDVAIAKPIVLVSVEPLALIVREICHDECEAKTILPKGGSEHSWLPGPKDIIAAKQAVSIVGIGLDFDNLWLKKLGIDSSKAILIGSELSPMGWWSDDLSGASHNDAAHHHEDHHAHNKFDPHIWTDAGRMKRAAEFTAIHLKKTGAVSESGLTRAKAIGERLLKLDVAVDDRRKQWDVKPIVVFHDLVGYFARRYNLPVLAVSTGASGHDLSAKMIADVQRRFSGIKMAGILVEHEDGVARNLAKDLKISVHSFDFAGVKSYKNYDEWFLAFVDTWAAMMTKGVKP